MKHAPPPGFVEEAGLPSASAGRAVPSRPRVSKVPWLFVAVVIVPTLLAAIYYLLIAAPLYVSEAKFVVAQKDQTNTGGGLTGVLASVGASATSEEINAYEVQSYMLSRDAIHDLVRSADLIKVLGRPEGDFLFRFPRPFERVNIESVYNAYPRFVTVDYDLQTGISTLKVRAFRPGDAQRIALALMDRGEAWVTRLNDKALADAVEQSERQVQDAQARVAAAQTALTTYRNKERLIDPDKSSAADLELIGQIEGQIAMLRAERAGLAASAPESPQLPVLDRRIAAYVAQEDAVRARTAGEADSLAPKVAEYQRLLLDRDIQAKALEGAVRELESARLDARRQQLFVQRVVSPSLPDHAQEPRRLLTIFIVLVTSLVLFAIISLVVAGLQEHQQK